MVYLRMELHAPAFLAFYLISGYRHLFCGSDNLESFRKRSDGVAVAHPHLAARLDAVQEGIGFIYLRENGASELAAVGGFNLASSGHGHELRSVADAENGIAAAYLFNVDFESFLIVNREGRA